MKIAVEGCCHGELDKIYETLQYLERVNGIKVDLLLICGDFQAVRNRDDLSSMAVPRKFQLLNTFYKYYSGEKEAPVLTVFIGGNHEASNYMQELPYGGWVAKNIYYMGYANVIEVGGLRIGGLSGIYKKHDYFKGHFERAPYTEDTKRSVYHIRNLEVFRLKQLTRPVDIMMSHDWPQDIARYGDMEVLFRKKPFLRTEVLDSSLGSPPAAELLNKLQPAYWFSAHLHVKYTAVVQHSPQKCTKFLSLDKCLPRRQFLQVLDFPDPPVPGPLSIKLDPEWLCILKATNHLLHLGRSVQYMPGPSASGSSDFKVSDEDIAEMKETFGGNLTLPHNFKRTAPTLSEQQKFKANSEPVLINEQTTLLCTMLDLTDPSAVHLGISSHYPIEENLAQCEATDNSDCPSDINSSIDTSFGNISSDFSDSCNTPIRNNLASRLSVCNSTSPSVCIENDDDELQAILAAQRRNSMQLPVSAESNGNSVTPRNVTSVDCTTKASSQTLPNEDATIDNEFASIIAAQKCNSEKIVDLQVNKLSDDAASSEDREQPQTDSSFSSRTDHTEGSTEDDSPGGGTKRGSPDALTGAPSEVKRLKRRNVSVYTSS